MSLDKTRDKNIRQWADYLGIKYCTLIGRLTTRTWSIEKVLSTSIMNGGA